MAITRHAHGSHVATGVGRSDTLSTKSDIYVQHMPKDEVYVYNVSATLSLLGYSCPYTWEHCCTTMRCRSTKQKCLDADHVVARVTKLIKV